MLMEYPSPKPVNFPRVMLHVYDRFPLQVSGGVCTDCRAVSMAGERYSCSRWHPMLEAAWGQLARLDFLRGVPLNFK